jgi:hypothetical protein
MQHQTIDNNIHINHKQYFIQYNKKYLIHNDNVQSIKHIYKYELKTIPLSII